jgi:cytochrome oxidase assembly protein ShyY1
MEKLKFKPVEKMKRDGEYVEVKIRCRYCDLKDSCHLREQKEAYEEAGWITRCPFTPNRPKKKKSRSKKK